MTNEQRVEHYHKDAAYALLGVCRDFSPTGREQQAFTNVYNDLLATNESSEEVAKQLASALLDGLRHGNWPKGRVEQPEVAATGA